MPRMALSAQLRLVFIVLALACALVAIFPESDLLPFQKELQTSRTPQAATQAVRWLFTAGAFFSIVVFVAWYRIYATITSLVRWLVNLSDRRFWTMVTALSILLRLSIAIFFPPLLLDGGDGKWYHDAAISIAHGRGLEVYGMPTAYRPPGYPWLLAIPYRLFGVDVRWAWLWGIVATIIIIVATYMIANRLYGNAVAKLATLAIAIYPALALSTGEPGSDIVFLAGLMLVLCVALFIPPYRWVQTIGIGIALGLLTLTRSVAIGLFLVVPIIWHIKQANRAKLVLHSILLTITFMLCLLPWMWRNYSTFGALTLGTNMGFNLYIGNHVGASGGYDVDILPAALRQSNRQLNEAQVDQIFLQEAIRFVVSNPLDAIMILPKKMVQLFLLQFTEAESLFQNHPFWFKYTMYGVTQIFYLPILMLFCARAFQVIVLNNRPCGLQRTGWIVAIYFTLLCLIFFGMDRYRLPFLPWMMIESGVVLAQICKVSNK